jgi:zinc and cadmium transporter
LRWLAILFLALTATQTLGAVGRNETIPGTPDAGIPRTPGSAVVGLPESDGGSSRATNGALLTAYCVAIVAVSLIGGWLPSRFRINHTQMQTVISFVGGLMLGIGVFHLLPHSIHGALSVDEAVWWMMAGILAMFLLIRCFHFHHHGPLEISTSTLEPCSGLHDHDHDHDHGRSPAHNHAPQPAARPANASLALLAGNSPPHCHHAHQLSWLGIAVGLSLHTLIDGMALAASVEGDSRHPMRLSLFGLGTFLAILLHKPLDAVSITSLMAGSGWSSRSRVLVNLGFSLMCPLGALLFVLGVKQLTSVQDSVISAALAFSAGVFLCISLSDLLPEMEFHAHNRLQLTIALLGGILLAYGITFLEPAHMHGSSPTATELVPPPSSGSPH